ncbi:MAG: homocysteine S-methyltransferase family protein [Clostridia bacterium]|nr:homocysteine S-methyltransferase family protein [Clostridia bacterium]
MDFFRFLKDNIVCLDGGMGTLLQSRGLKPGEHPEKWNITHPDIITEIHKSYYDAGSNVVSTNTFGANILKFSEEELDSIIKAAVSNARSAARCSVSQKEKFVALDIGPSGKLLKPLGDLDFEDAVSVFAKTVKLGVKYGVDLIIIETMNDSYETKAALLAAKENSELPVIVSNAYGEDGKLMTGADPMAMVALLEGMGADAIGANCSLGPKQLRGVALSLIENASVPVVLKPNAGLPKVVEGKTVFDITPDEFSDEVADLVKSGVRVMGGCCGTTPEYIKLLNEKTEGFTPVPLTDKNLTVVSSYSHAVKFGDSPILIGERINPTGKKRFKAALLENDMDYILNEGVNQQEKGVHVLDVNVGLPEIDEAEVLKKAVCELQTVTDLPLQIDTADAVAMEGALRRYNGKAMINSVNGKSESMDKVFPLVKKYGGLVVALTLDESGIPSTSEGRLAIARKILDRAAEYGISKKDIIFDPLALTVSADNKAASETADAVRRIKNELGCHTSLGVSNVSFGLPNRDAINSVFFAMCLNSGLSAAIMNPYSSEMMKTYYAFRALNGLDENCADYIAKADSFAVGVILPAPGGERSSEEYGSELKKAVIKGFKERASEITRDMLCNTDPLEIVNDEIIPALNTVGKGFEEKKVYLPQLLMSAEAAKCAFEEVKAFMAGGQKASNRGSFVLATVYGDIHDIGKNIVKLLLENYGFNVIDLGKDVPPTAIADKVLETKAPMVGLSALMTTTVPAMEETIKLLREKAPFCKIIVGGAVLTRDYAEKIGADGYAKDAMDGVRFAESVVGK